MLFNGVKVFSATMVADRNMLGEKVTEWIRDHPDLEVVDVTITQSSDSSFHCIVITVFYNENLSKEVIRGVQQEQAQGARVGRKNVATPVGRVGAYRRNGA